MLKLKRVVESQGNNFSWKDLNVQKAIMDTVKGLEVDKKNTTDKELIFVLNGKNGSLHLQGYMLVLDTDTDDNIPPVNYPVRDRSNLTLDNLMDTIKVVFTRLESLNKIKQEDKEVKESLATVEKRVDEDEVEGGWVEEVDEVGSCPRCCDLSSIHNSPVFQDVAKERVVEKLRQSLLLAPPYEGECAIPEEDCKEIIWVYLSPSYSIDLQSDIVIPISLKDRKVSLPVSGIPSPITVFGGEEVEDPLKVYKESVQSYLLNDVPMSEIINIDMENSDDVKASVVSLVNTMAEDYLEKKMDIEKGLDTEGEGLLSESRYFIVPEDTDVSEGNEVTFLTPLGYTDLSVAKNDLNDMANSGRYTTGLKILDTNFSKNKNKWVVL